MHRALVAYMQLDVQFRHVQTPVHVHNKLTKLHALIQRRLV